MKNRLKALMQYHIKKKGDLVIIFVQKLDLYANNEHG
jgi:hypothetical protein